jgi:hypothetical protein
VNRRTYLKSTLILGSLGLASLSVFKWIDVTKPVNPALLWSKKDIIAELAELIIPETDTPGAKSASVPDYIINVLINCMDIKKQNKFYAGIEDLEVHSTDNYGKKFLDCTATERLEIFDYFARHAGFSNRILNKINNKFFGQPFYLTLRALTIEGYCMSEKGATQGLAYDYIPVNYDACIPLQPNQKSWATK